MHGITQISNKHVFFDVQGYSNLYDNSIEENLEFITNINSLFFSLFGIYDILLYTVRGNSLFRTANVAPELCTTMFHKLNKNVWLGPMQVSMWTAKL